ncbi:ABC transporter permease subunit [Frankia sp. CNm7]|uniref:ABC transporter permease subunit n=1 Tax=Frankia nepalensis TaxID=1836974 RepID=A0A937REB9_9ACTN|nr:ABC transporter permease subunit [Frankia nepalensis]MBL7495502.1 ABC transporter permease subunit [Frankia nepalensis]MBL7510871.1 ABC transporter permease subunit [Frankia nepalensis]MBL7520404.1 ABC transporter permease subunit [Frankia nepalensis]MBL7630606.1 ABC transporter permease subunit [Frankia nepalensis]
MTAVAPPAAPKKAAASVSPPADAARRRGGRGSGLLATALVRLGRTFGSVIASVAVILGLWYAFLEVFDLNKLVAKRPEAVYRYLFTAPKAPENRREIFEQLMHTLGDAAAGYVAGTAAAMVVAVLFVLYRPVEQSFMPIAMILRSVPLVAMTPIITLVFGRDLLGVTVIAGIVVFFPSLVNLVFGLRSTPQAASDLVLAYGGSPLTVLRKVALPSALPALFVSARIAVPGAIIGALLAEWLATGKGLGYYMQHAQQTFNYSGVWTSVVVITAVSVVIYAVVGVIETIVLARYGPAPARGK